MKLQDYTKAGADSRLAVLGLLTSRKVLSALAPQWEKPGLFRDSHLNVIGNWAVNHFRRHGKPLGRQVETEFARWAEARKRDPATVELVRTFLEALSSEFEQTGRAKPEYVLETAAGVFSKARLQTLKADLEDALEAGDLAGGWDKVQSCRPVQVGQTAGFSFLTDARARAKAFGARHDPLIAFPPGSGLAGFFGPALGRGKFVAFMGPDKVGKTQILIELTWQAVLQNRNVAFFQVGDLDEDEMVQRLSVRATGRPLEPQTVTYPVDITALPARGTGHVPVMETVERTWKKPLTRAAADAACLKVIEGGVDGDRLRVFVHPGDTLTVAAVRGTLDALALGENWVPDVCVFDYADLLATEDHARKDQKRDQINATWVALRALALTPGRNCLVLTATQTDASAYGADTITMKNFSNDKRKLAHVSGMVGINCTDQEKEAGTMRFNWVVGRAWKYSARRFLYLAGSAALANPMMCSKF